MDNYLSHRWPKGPGVQPPPMPAPQPTAAPRRKAKWSPRRWAVSIVCIVLCVALLGGASFWAVSGLAEVLTSMEPPAGSSDPPSPHHTWHIPSTSDWSTDDLPWGEPDPSVRLSVEAAGGDALTGREIHRLALPSIVYVEARGPANFGLGIHSGTGVVVTRSGYVLTNYHVTAESSRVRIMLLTGDSTYYDAKVIGFDEEFDIAVLKFEGEGLDLTPARLGDSDALAVGDPVYAEGNPMGYLLGSMTEGIVSALDRDDEVEGNGMAMIQTSAALNPGNSGGALLNEQGQVVGITSAKITGLSRDSDEDIEDAAVLENMGLALPISDILPFVNRILATGKSWRPYIGIMCKEADQDGRRGLLVDSVEDGVPAREAGLRKGDLIISANGVAVTALPMLRRQIYRTGVDGELHCIIVRDGVELPLTFALIDRPAQADE